MIPRLLERLASMGLWLSIELGRLAVRIFPRRYLLSLFDGIADIGFHLFRDFRKRSINNFSSAMGEQLDAGEIAQVVHRSLRNFLRDFVEIGFVLEASREQIRAEISLQGREHLEAALARGKGVIALSAHLGNFFLVGTRLAVEDFPAHVLVNQSQEGGVPKLMDHYRLHIGQKTIHARPRHQAFLELMEVLRRNQIAIVIADEYRSGSGVYVPFFGRTVLARRGPITLALRTGATLVPVYLIREPSGKLRMIIEPEIGLARSGRIQTDVRENTLRITQWLERTVRSYPDQWNWMNVRWQETALPLVEKKQQVKESVA